MSAPSDPPTTFRIGANKPPPTPPYPELEPDAVSNKRVECAYGMGDCRPRERSWIKTSEQLPNKLVEAVLRAFRNHHGIVFTPDVIANTLWHGFADHINSNPEKWRAELGIQFEGKEDIKVLRDDFELGNPKNDWESVFPEFSAKIRQVIDPDLHDNILGEYSTTGPVERLASDIVLMDTVQSFLNYTLMTRCGIPEVTILGTSEDWQLLKRRFQTVERFDLGWWVPGVVEILDKFIEKVRAREKGAKDLDVPGDDEFWSSIFNYMSASGGPFLSGWLMALFPYIGSNKPHKNDFIDWRQSKLKPMRGVNPGDLPKSASIVPMTWIYFGEHYEMELHGGLMGVSFNAETQRIRPEFGWAVCYK